jgi:hypothetical protein
MKNCEMLSPNAQEIFNKLKPFFPPDSWKTPHWEECGIVTDNGTFDLRKADDRKKLTDRTEMTLGSFVEIVAKGYLDKNATLEGFEHHHFGPLFKSKVELLFILNDLDFQIETGDLVDEACSSKRPSVG